MAGVRPVFQPKYNEMTANIAAGSAQRVQTQIEDLDADTASGILIRNVSVVSSLALTDDTDTPLASDYARGFFGMFKWPVDATAPTTATLDYQNRAKVFCRTPFAINGNNPQRLSFRCKTVTLRPGDVLYMFIFAITVSANQTLWAPTLMQYWINESV